MGRFLIRKHFPHLDSRFKRLYPTPALIPKSQDLPALPDDVEPESWKSIGGLLRCPANYTPLSPISFLNRSAKVYRDRTSVVYGSVKYTWSQTHQRCLKLASALSQLGISRGDVVAALAPNVPAMYELHFAIPMAGAVLCTLNTRHDSAMLSVLLKHSEAKVLFVDHQLLETARRALDVLAKSQESRKPPILILISQSDDVSSITASSSSLDTFDYDYEGLIASGSSEFEAVKPRSELDPISINYTSGTTRRPKGVVNSYRGAYLNSLATAFLPNMCKSPVVYLWTVPMFHSNGWSLTWGVAAQGGTNVCLRKVSAKGIFDKIAAHKVTHMAGAPTVLNMIVNSSANERKHLSHPVEVMTGGSQPPPQVFARMEELGFSVSHVYGLTETFGVGTYCTSEPEWDSLSAEERSKLKARQGIQHLVMEDVDVKDPVTMKSVPANGATVGEIMFRGNGLMCGYLKNLKETKEAFEGGWFHTGDLGVQHPDGFIEIKDRLKDIIISGGENIHSVEVETVLYGHPAVLEAAIVARPDDHWGQTPCAFVKLREGFDNVTPEELIKFCRDRLPSYMAPKTVVFGDLPRTSTGKIQKHLLRERAREMGSLS